MSTTRDVLFYVTMLLVTSNLVLSSYDCHNDNTCKHKASSTCNLKDPSDIEYILAVQQPDGLQYVKPNKFIPKQVDRKWTIHGLWPSNTDSCDCPSCCMMNVPFKKDKIKNLESEMKSVWMSLTHKSNHVFWGHEWCRHGTCAAEQLTTNGDRNIVGTYFNTTLQLNQKYSIENILDNHNITPGSTYKKEKLLNAIQGVIKVTPYLLCFDKDEKSILIGMFLCFKLHHDDNGATFLPINCDTFKKAGEDCVEQTECSDHIYYHNKSY